MRRIQTRLALLCSPLLALLSACAAPGAMMAVGRSPVEAVAALPEEMAGFRREGPVTDLERLPGGAGLGASARYVPANGERVIATVYVYDRGARRAPDGGSSPDVQAELRAHLAEVQLALRVGRYRSFTPDLGMSLGRDGASADIRCSNFRLVLGNGTPTGDSVCVTVQNGAFVKTRVTSFTVPEPTVAGLLAGGLLSAAVRARAPGS